MWSDVISDFNQVSDMAWFIFLIITQQLFEEWTGPESKGSR